ncbi:MAG TPA: NAD-dependent epimerase/dehydratase family protein, partial [Chromatiales bacterium]|nr:NAD-dependent epimerase/dehydratase family protein [Chromatiales bacterium]
VVLGLQGCLYLGNLEARRDWGHARDYVEMMWLMLQQDAPEDYVIASGEQHSVREFVETAAGGLGIGLRWEGSGREETGIVATVDPAGRYEPPPSLVPGAVIVRVDPRYFRPTEVETLLGDPTKAREKLGWRPQVPFGDLVREMIDADFELARRDELCRSAGFTVPDRHE